ncbi:NADH oxidoreductase hcr [Serratia sp. DD3]|nr:NADH oxidoreductase hcr [Serratia sp. DD3]
MTPIMPILTLLAKEHASFHSQVFLSFKEPKDFLFQDEILKLQNSYQNIDVNVNFSRMPSKSKVYSYGRIAVQEILIKCPDIVARKVFICGPGGYVESLTSILADIGILTENIISEIFSVNAPDHYKDSIFDVVFNDSGTVVQANGDKTLLELAESSGLYIPSVCRNGLCGACIVRVKGETTGGCTEVLSSQSILDGNRLACCTYPIGTCEVVNDI